MIESQLPKDPSSIVTPQSHPTKPTSQTRWCNCGTSSIDPVIMTVPCNVRAFSTQSFDVWRCPSCQTVHCADQVDLDHYYAKYPFAGAQLSLPLRLCYRNLLRQLVSLEKHHSFLDYGCADGLFVQYLQSLGFEQVQGYDPYGDPAIFGNPQALTQKYNYILLQDVIEHVEDAQELLISLDHLLLPGGCILIGTPNADRIDLAQSQYPEYYNALHVPYHRHIYSADRLQTLGINQGWQVMKYFDRPFHDTRWFGLNARAWNIYQALCDGTLNAIFEEINVGLALSSLRFWWWYAVFGYWLSLKTDMAVLFRKP
jgi:2-polyprenyl-3-methyl-5-hydroxy-6-metoxy-1,4-benzoquinol methylase